MDPRSHIEKTDREDSLENVEGEDHSNIRTNDENAEVENPCSDNVSHPVKEMLAVSLVLFSFLAWAPIADFTFLYLLFTDFWWVSCLYLAWWVCDLPAASGGGRRKEGLVSWVRGLRVWSHFSNYFPVTLIKTADLDPSEKHLLCSHPHGLLCLGSLAAFSTEANSFSEKFPGIFPRITSLEGNFWRPIFREFFLSFGAISASRKSLDSILGCEKAGEVPVLMIGGMPEMEQREENKIKLFLKNRKGFVKLALTHGVNLVPSFSFGETSTYRQNSKIGLSVQNWMKRFVGIAPVIFCGRGFLQTSFGLLPQKNRINVVVGTPIKVTKVSTPSEEEIDELHLQYVKALQGLYDAHNKMYGNERIQLEIQ